MKFNIMFSKYKGKHKRRQTNLLKFNIFLNMFMIPRTLEMYKLIELDRDTILKKTGFRKTYEKIESNNVSYCFI